MLGQNKLDSILSVFTKTQKRLETYVSSVKKAMETRAMEMSRLLGEDEVDNQQMARAEKVIGQIKNIIS